MFGSMGCIRVGRGGGGGGGRGGIKGWIMDGGYGRRRTSWNIREVVGSVLKDSSIM